MHTNDLENKKINNEQKVNEGFSGEKLPENYNPAPEKLQQQTETDADGNQQIVHRARPEATNDEGLDDNQSRKAVENRDRNSDTAANRYPNDHPDNQVHRGNINAGES